MASDRPPEKPPKKPSDASDSTPSSSGPSALERYLAKQKLEKLKQEKLASPPPKPAKAPSKTSLLRAFLKSPDPLEGEFVGSRTSENKLGRKASLSGRAGGGSASRSSEKPSLVGIERPPLTEAPQPPSLQRWESVAETRLAESERDAKTAHLPKTDPSANQTPPFSVAPDLSESSSASFASDVAVDDSWSAEFGSRFLAYVVDILILSALAWPLRSTASLVLMTVTGGWVSARSEGVDTILFLGLQYAYYGYFYSTKAASPGKLLMGLEIYEPDGHTKLTYWKAFFREAVGKLISTIPFLMGFIIVLIRPDRRALHDLLFDTRVVYRRRLKIESKNGFPEERF